MLAPLELVSIHCIVVDVPHPFSHTSLNLSSLPVDPSVDTLVTFTNDGPVLSDPKTKYCAMVTLKLCPTADNCADVAMATCSRDISAPTSGDHEATDGFDSTITKTNRVNAKDADEDRDATFIIECDNPIQWEQIPCVRLTSDDPDFEWSITSIVGNLAALLGPFAETGDLTPTLSLPTPFATSIEICFGVPIDYFVAGAVEITVAADWQYSPSPSRRALRGLQDGDITSGEISETLEMNVDTSGVPPELLGTAAGAEYYKYSFVGMCLAAGAAVAAV
ncbi:MAG: hypothetical protein SGILL_005876 [Bacillariaceae sp.]